MENLKHLLDAGHRLIPLKAGLDAKLPRDKGYATRDYTLDELTGNVGMIVSRGMVDVDFDWPEAGAFCEAFLPLSGVMFARQKAATFSPVTHLVYRCDLDEPIDFKLPKVAGRSLDGPHGNTILQLRTAKGEEPYHVMIPPSVHPSGEPLLWVKLEGLPFDMVEIDKDELLRRAGMVAAFAFLVRFYPGAGQRDDFALALTGAMLRAGWTDEDVSQFIVALCRAAGDDEELEMRSSKAARSRARLSDGRPVRGLTSAAKMMGVPWEWMREVAVWLGLRKRASSDGPAVFLGGTIAETSKQAWAALEDYVIDGDPADYAYGETLARIDRDRIEILNSSRLSYELSRCARWLKKNQKGDWVVLPEADGSVVADMLAARARDVTLRPLQQMAVVPMFTRTGRLLNANGYDDEFGIFLALNVEVEVPAVPTTRDVWRALKDLWEPIRQFPFVDKSDKVHALAMMIEPYVRDMFDATPLYFINKPAAGTGASLMIETALYPALGMFPEAQTPPSGEEEMTKTLLAKLKDGAKVIFFDNANKLDSAALASAITTARFTGRILGASETLTVPVRVLWVGSGNNTEMSGELYRRFVDIRIDARIESPEDRTGFRIADLKGWIRDNRPRQVRAALTIIQYWVNQGMPKGRSSKASFESWALVMGGIMETLHVHAFLKTPPDRKPQDPEIEGIRELLLTWWKLQRGTATVGNPDVGLLDWAGSVKAKDVAALIEAQNIGLELGWGDRVRMAGNLLRRYDGRPFGFETRSGATIMMTLRKKPINGSFSWRLEAERTSDEPVGDGRRVFESPY